MQIFQDFFETRKRSFISAFSICMTVPLNESQVKSICIKKYLPHKKRTGRNKINLHVHTK